MVIFNSYVKLPEGKSAKLMTFLGGIPERVDNSNVQGGSLKCAVFLNSINDLWMQNHGKPPQCSLSTWSNGASAWSPPCRHRSLRAADPSTSLARHPPGRSLRSIFRVRNLAAENLGKQPQSPPKTTTRQIRQPPSLSFSHFSPRDTVSSCHIWIPPGAHSPSSRAPPSILLGGSKMSLFSSGEYWFQAVLKFCHLFSLTLNFTKPSSLDR